MSIILEKGRWLQNFSKCYHNSANIVTKIIIKTICWLHLISLELIKKKQRNWQRIGSPFWVIDFLQGIIQLVIPKVNQRMNRHGNFFCTDGEYKEGGRTKKRVGVGGNSKRLSLSRGGIWTRMDCHNKITWKVKNSNPNTEYFNLEKIKSYII